MTFSDPLPGYMTDAVLDAIARGKERLARAQRILRADAENMDKRIGDMVRMIANGLPRHPDPIGLCERRSTACAVAIEFGDDCPNAFDMRRAANVLARAADVLRGVEEVK